MLGAAALWPVATAAAPASPWQAARRIADTIPAPAIPRRDVPITRHGAVAGGPPATAAIAAAIAACAAAGGGRVVVPPGRFHTGAIRLGSNMALHLSAGATLVFSTDPADYPMVATRWEGVECVNYAPLVFADGETDVAITGTGTLDGQGAAWWPWSSGPQFGWKPGMPDQRAARTRLFAMAEAGVPVAERRFGAGGYLRPPLVQFQNCARVLVEGVTLRDSPLWNCHAVLCRDVVMRGVAVRGHGPNNDGCNPESVDRMLIERCTFDTGDDCIAIKSGRNANGRRVARPAQDIVIRDCRMRAGHGGLVIGSEISGDVRRVFMERCTMDSPDLWYAVRIKNNAMRGGAVDQVHCRDIRVGQVARAAITCDFNYEEGANGGFRPSLSNLLIERMDVARAPQVADIQGLPGAPVSDITLRDCRFAGVTRPSVVAHIDRLGLNNVRVNGRPVSRI
ncbi:glycoside hydrolase family 28 protein [Polymorphobacter fuscus]|uniref:Glycoside hydrolase family 28 protein n=2 Tax=Sandarakinorhabdus fusca TaxID=1439888 RepID=A0A7C9GRK6_9SPHN|nr:glycoside hydrolase family 28 protein [Polymorphobacter fuscus]MQT18476.1 glycoside hydrolase family 28 protein [Polymorphobacter fuscus]